MMYKVTWIGADEALHFEAESEVALGQALLDYVDTTYEVDSETDGTDVWYVFPDAAAPLPPVLERIHTSDYLVTKHNLQLLASKLIYNGLVDSSSCPNYGLNLDGKPNGCGEQAAAKMVFDYQNQYDSLIYDASNKQNVPPRIVKGLIAQESQFWPHSDKPYEYGLGMLTESGADMLLRWNSSYFLDLCYETYRMKPDKCMGGFSGLTEDEQAVMRGVVISKVGTNDELYGK